MHAVDAGLLVNAVSGAFMVALGMFVGTVQRESRTNRAFALFAIAFGSTWIVENLVGPSAGHIQPLSVALPGLLLMVAAVGLALFAVPAPRPVPAAERRRLWFCVGVGVAVILADAAFLFGLSGLSIVSTWADAVTWLGFWAFHGVSWATLVLFASRHRALEPHAVKEASGLRLMSIALMLYPAFSLARETMVLVVEIGANGAIALAGLLLVVAQAGGVAALWLRNSARSEHPTRERLVAWAVLAAALAGIPGLGLAGNHPGFGITRTAGVVVLAYAIIRHQVLGIDVKVRWGISRSTIAAAFVAVFFIASEGAQLVFGQQNEVVGLFAAGALVFAIAPLQRAAERLAAKAVPAVEATPAGGTGAAGRSAVGTAARAREAAYQNAVRLALRDRALTREEELRLHELAEQLGIGAGRAHALLLGVEREGPPPLRTRSQEESA